MVQNKDKIKGVIITHGHEDHIGALPYLLKQVNLPVYATRLTIGLIKNKLEEHGLLGRTKLVEIAPRQEVQAGLLYHRPHPREPLHPRRGGLCHRVPGGRGHPDRRLQGRLHSSLRRAHRPGRLRGVRRPRACWRCSADSTNAERPGFTATEQKVGQSFANLFRRADKQRIIIATFASNLYRIQQIIDLAVENGRKVAVRGRSMANNTQMALELGYLHAPEGVLIDIEQLNKYPPEKIVLITTGSQGEPLSALSRMASSSHRNVHVGPGDFIIISATPIPGNEKMVTKVVNGLLLLGAEVIYESMYDVHVSGHACQEEQKLILTLTAPKFFLPVHGEYKQLKKHAMTAESLGIPAKNIHIAEIGQDIRLSADGLETCEPVPAGAVMVDGLGVGDVGNVVLRDRRHLSQDGLVIVVATVSADGQLLAGPDLVSRGFVYVRESEELMDEARKLVIQCFERCRAERTHDWNSVKTRVRETLSAYIYRRTKRSPMILPILMEV